MHNIRKNILRLFDLLFTFDDNNNRIRKSVGNLRVPTVQTDK